MLNRGYQINLASPSSLGISATSQTADTTVMAATGDAGGDIPDQKPMADPPAVIKAIYATAWTAGSAERMADLINLIKTTQLNAVVIDIKDYSGYVSYAMDVPAVQSSGAEDQIRIARPNALIKELHDNNIYVIGRITVFEDPILAKARPDLAIKSAKTGEVWKDSSGLSWMDPTEKDTWNYVVDIANDAAARGFDEVNFDYVRFPSDGTISQLSYPSYTTSTPKSVALENFFKYLHENVKGVKTSADVFGLTTVADNDMGIGQVIQDAAPYFDYIAPMVYPSHYADGFIGYKNPADYPYQVINYSIENGVDKFLKLEPASSTTSTPVQIAKFRPWLQAFDLGATYTPTMLESEMQAVTDSLCITQPTGDYPPSPQKAPGLQCSTHQAQVQDMWSGWMLWNAASQYDSYASALGTK
jgi:hypothetical protein